MTLIDVAPLDILIIRGTLETFHFETSPLKDGALWNILVIRVASAGDAPLRDVTVKRRHTFEHTMRIGHA